MMIGFPIVSDLKRFKSADNRHGKSPATPITSFVDAATIMDSFLANVVTFFGAGIRF